MIKDEGTVNFWVDPKKNPNAFTEGTKYRWINFELKGERVDIVSEGKMLKATMNQDTDKELMIFSHLVDLDLSKKHMISLTWSPDYLTLYFDGNQEYQLPVEDYN